MILFFSYLRVLKREAFCRYHKWKSITFVTHMKINSFLEYYSHTYYYYYYYYSHTYYSHTYYSHTYNQYGTDYMSYVKKNELPSRHSVNIYYIGHIFIYMLPK